MNGRTIVRLVAMPVFIGYLGVCFGSCKAADQSIKTAKTTVTVAVADTQETSQAVTPDPYANETKEERNARMRWWREAKFGMFIHWGVYAVPAGTWKGNKSAGSVSGS